MFANFMDMIYVDEGGVEIALSPAELV